MFPLKDNTTSDRRPAIAFVLVAANVIAYLVTMRHFTAAGLWSGPRDTTLVHAGAIPYELTHPGHYCSLHTGDVIACGHHRPDGGQLPFYATAFSAMFLHSDLLHLAGNMFFLALLGPGVEDRLGHLRFALLYLLGGLAALGVQVLVGPASSAPTLGASGAVAAVVGAYIVLFPRARIVTLVTVIFFFTVVELPVLVMLVLWFGEQIAFAATGLTDPLAHGGSVPYVAHVGGFLFGLATIRGLRLRASPRVAL